MNDRYEFRVTQEELVMNYMAIDATRAIWKSLGLSNDFDLAVMSMAQMITMCTWDKQNDCRAGSDYGWELINGSIKDLLTTVKAFMEWLHETFEDEVEDERLRPFKEFLDGIQ